MGADTGTQPGWIEAAPEKGSFRSIFKWGDPHGYKHPNAKLFQLLKETFGLTDDHFRVPVNDGNRPVAYHQPPRVITPDHAAAITRIVGDENVSADDYDRLKFATGKTMEESLRLRQGEVQAVSDLVISQEYVTPVGDLKTLDFPATANGPSVDRMMIGSEGCFGVLVEITLKIFRYLPENRRYFSFVFPSWEKAVDAGREIAQGQFGMPAVFRISGPRFYLYKIR